MHIHISVLCYEDAQCFPVGFTGCFCAPVHAEIIGQIRSCGQDFSNKKNCMYKHVQSPKLHVADVQERDQFFL